MFGKACLGPASLLATHGVLCVQRGGAIGPTAQHFKAKEMPRPWTGDAGGARDAIGDDDKACTAACDPRADTFARLAGVVVAVPSTWTCDVGWANGETGSG